MSLTGINKLLIENKCDLTSHEELYTDEAKGARGFLEPEAQRRVPRVRHAVQCETCDTSETRATRVKRARYGQYEIDDEACSSSLVQAEDA